MTALVTGASSGLGRCMAQCLAKRGFNLVIVARRKHRLIELKKYLCEEFGVKVKIICRDLSKTEECKALYEDVKKADIDILINNAGFGVYGKFTDTDLDDELKMIDVNIKAVHILTKLFLIKFKEGGHGYILNTASLAGFMAGPFFSSYYASKNYVVQLTKAIHEELREEKSNVYIGAFCPGPVNTEFNEISGAEFAVSGMDEMVAAQYAIEKMFDGQMIILPNIIARLAALSARIFPDSIMLPATGKVQSLRQIHSNTGGDINGSGDMKLRLSEDELNSFINDKS